jgi:hypothetical protein
MPASVPVNDKDDLAHLFVKTHDPRPTLAELPYQQQEQHGLSTRISLS